MKNLTVPSELKPYESLLKTLLKQEEEYSIYEDLLDKKNNLHLNLQSQLKEYKSKSDNIQTEILQLEQEYQHPKSQYATEFYTKKGVGCWGGLLLFSVFFLIFDAQVPILFILAGISIYFIYINFKNNSRRAKQFEIEKAKRIEADYAEQRHRILQEKETLKTQLSSIASNENDLKAQFEEKLKNIENEITQVLLQLHDLIEEATIYQTGVPFKKLHNYPKGLEFVITNVSDGIYDTPQKAMQALITHENFERLRHTVATSFEQQTRQIHQAIENSNQLQLALAERREQREQQRHQEVLASQDMTRTQIEKGNKELSEVATVLIDSHNKHTQALEEGNALARERNKLLNRY